MPRYVVTIDADSITELSADPYAPDATTALTRLATDANVTFTNVELVPAFETIFFAATESLAFDASADDVRTYLAFYDADDDAIITYDAYLALRP